jgi:hypothetical protein
MVIIRGHGSRFQPMITAENNLRESHPRVIIADQGSTDTYMTGRNTE